MVVCKDMLATNKTGNYIQHNIQVRLCNHRCDIKAVFNVMGVSMYCFSVTQYAKCTHHIISSSVTCRAVSYFSVLTHKWHDFWKKIIEHKMRVSIFSATFNRNISNSKRNSARQYHKCTCLQIRCPIFLPKFHHTLKLSRLTFKKSSHTKLHRSLSSGSRVVPHMDEQMDGRADGQTDQQPDWQAKRRNEVNQRLSQLCEHA
jgi:hypothetical protein